MLLLFYSHISDAPLQNIFLLEQLTKITEIHRKASKQLIA